MPRDVRVRGADVSDGMKPRTRRRTCEQKSPVVNKNTASRPRRDHRNPPRKTLRLCVSATQRLCGEGATHAASPLPQKLRGSKKRNNGMTLRLDAGAPSLLAVDYGQHTDHTRPCLQDGVNGAQCALA